MAMPPRSMPNRFQASADPNEAAENESAMMDRMEGPADTEAVHQAPKRKHRRRIALSDMHKQYPKGRK